MYLILVLQVVKHLKDFRLLHEVIFFFCDYRVFVIYNKSGRWVYPVLAVLNWGQKSAFFLVLLCLVSGLYLVGEKLNNFIWGKLQLSRKCSQN